MVVVVLLKADVHPHGNTVVQIDQEHHVAICQCSSGTKSQTTYHKTYRFQVASIGSDAW